MSICEVDLLILREFCKLKENEYTTSWSIMKKIFPKGRDKDNMTIKQRIEIMSKYGLFKVEGKPKIYTLDSEKVFLRRMKFPNKKSESIFILANGKWEVFQI